MQKFNKLILKFKFHKKKTNLDGNINIFIFVNIIREIKYNKTKNLKSKIHNSNVTKRFNYVIWNHEAGSDTFH